MVGILVYCMPLLRLLGLEKASKSFGHLWFKYRRMCIVNYYLGKKGKETHMRIFSCLYIELLSMYICKSNGIGCVWVVGRQGVGRKFYMSYFVTFDF